MTRRHSRSAAEGKLDMAMAKKFAKRLTVFGLTKPKPVSQTVKKAISKAINRNSELKMATNLTVADQVNVTGAGLNTPVGLGYVSSSSIIPIVVQGAGESNRNGNSIRPKRLSLRYTLRALPTTDGASPVNNNPFKGIPFLVRVIVFKHRWAIDEASQTGILQQGNSSQNLGSTPDNWLNPYNKDEYKIYYSKSFKFSALSHISSTGVYNTENQANGFQTFAMKKVSIKLPETLKFNDNNGAPTNEGFFLAVACCNVDGTVILNSQSRLQINAETYMSFYD